MQADSGTERDVARHYGRVGLAEQILQKLSEIGKDVNALTPEDLAPIEEFHVMGRVGTRTLASMADISSEDRVLDIGCGIGGPARFLAWEFGCQVTGLDLTPEYVEAATELTGRVSGFRVRPEFRQGSALDLPYADGSFTVVWLQHAGMNIEDKARLYGEAYRVLQPGGRFALHEIMAGERPVEFPVPWSRSPETSFLVAPSEARSLLEGAGFQVRQWEDSTDESVQWFEKMFAKFASIGPPPASLQLLLPDFPQLAQNLVRNFKENSARVIRGVAVKA